MRQRREYMVYNTSNENHEAIGSQSISTMLFGRRKTVPNLMFDSPVYNLAWRR